MARDTAPADGAGGRRHDRPRRRGASVQSCQCEGSPAGRCERTVDGLQLDNFAQRELLFEPGTKCRPSSYGWVLVSAAVEAAANEPFFAFMRTHVFEPLGMRDTTMDVATEAIPARAAFYWPMFGLAGDTRYGPKPARQETIPAMRAPPRSCPPSDLVRFGMGILGGKLLKSGTSQLLQTPQRLASSEETGYGLGWELETPSPRGTPHADGSAMAAKRSSSAARRTLMTFPERGLVVAVMANISFADTKSIALNIAQAFAEQGRSPARQ